MSRARLVRCACQWTVAAIDLASAINVGIHHAEAAQHQVDAISVYPLNMRPTVNPHLQERTTMMTKSASIKTWWKLDELQTIFPDAIEKMSAYLAAKTAALEADTGEPVSQPQVAVEVAQTAEQPAEEGDTAIATSTPKRSKARKSKR